jgi:hypothetical protein
MHRYLDINWFNSKAARRAAFELPCSHAAVTGRTDAITALAERCVR